MATGASSLVFEGCTLRWSMTMLDQIEIRGLKSIREVALPLRSLNVMIGANGSGKSNFIGAFGLLRELVEGRLQSAVAKAGGASSLLHHGPKHTKTIELKLVYGRTGYDVKLAQAEGDALFIEREDCWHNGEGFSSPDVVHLASAERESELRAEAAKHPGTIAAHVLGAMRSCSMHHFHDTSRTAPVKQKGDIDDNAVLRADAGNLAAFLFRLQKTDDTAYRRIVAVTRQVAPFFDDFALGGDRLAGDRIQLERLRRVLQRACAVGRDAPLHLPRHAAPPAEPAVAHPPRRAGAGLHPFAIAQLAAMLESASSRTQLLVGMQSVTLLNQLDPEAIVVVDRKEGPSTFRRIEPGEVSEWVDDYALGELWEKNVIGGTREAYAWPRTCQRTPHEPSGRATRPAR